MPAHIVLENLSNMLKRHTKQRVPQVYCLLIAVMDVGFSLHEHVQRSSAAIPRSDENRRVALRSVSGTMDVFVSKPR